MDAAEAEDGHEKTTSCSSDPRIPVHPDDPGTTVRSARHRWYKDHGYQFLVLTDHYTITVPESPSSSVDSSFLLIRGEEVTCWGKLSDIDVTALNIGQDIPPLTDTTLLGGLQKGIDAVRRRNGIPVITHPNYNWRLDQETMLNARDCRLFELFNGYSATNSEGGGGHPGLEQVWDFLLTAGMRIFGVAADDTHSLTYRSP